MRIDGQTGRGKAGARAGPQTDAQTGSLGKLEAVAAGQADGPRQRGGQQQLLGLGGSLFSTAHSFVECLCCERRWRTHLRLCVSVMDLNIYMRALCVRCVYQRRFLGFDRASGGGGSNGCVTG